MKTSEASAAFLNAKRAKNVRPATTAIYKWALSYLPLTMPRTVAILEETLGAMDLSAESKVNLWRIWKTFFRWSAKRLKTVDPTGDLEKPQRRKRVRRFLSREEIAAVLTACPVTQHALDGLEADLMNCPMARDHALVHLAMDTGLRNGELASLTGASFIDGALKVEGKAGERLVRVSPRVISMLSRFQRVGAVWVGRKGPLTTSGVNQAIRRSLRCAGLRPPKAGPHVLRHTFATWYIAQGGNVVALQALLGHQELTTTMVYVHMAQFIQRGELPHLSPVGMVQEAGRMWEEVGAILEKGDPE